MLLSDGVALESLVDQASRRVSLRACADPEIYALEMERVFGHAWQCVAHSSELAEPDTFLRRRIGPDYVVLQRHGPRVVGQLDWSDEARRTIAPAEAGRLQDVVERASGTLSPADARRTGATPSPSGRPLRLAELAGFIFGTWDDQAPEIEDVLGGMAWFLMMMFERTDAGLQVVGPPQRWVVKANWKLAAEQFSGDAYHAISLHRSMFDTDAGLNEGFLDAIRSAQALSFSGGHGTTARDSRFRLRQDGPRADVMPPPPGVPEALVDQLGRHLQPRQLAFLERFPPGPSSGHVFPNMSMLMSPMALANGEMGTNFTVRTWLPRAHDQMEALVWCLVERDASDEYKERVRQATTTSFSVTGMFEQDDAEAWTAIQRGLRGAMARRGFMSYAASSTPVEPATVSGHIGPLGPDDFVYRGWPRDDRQWRFWLRWLRYMVDDPWSATGAGTATGARTTGTAHGT